MLKLMIEWDGAFCLNTLEQRSVPFDIEACGHNRLIVYAFLLSRISTSRSTYCHSGVRLKS